MLTPQADPDLPVVNENGYGVTALAALLFLLSQSVSADPLSGSDGAYGPNGEVTDGGVEPTLELILFLGEWQPESDQWYEQMQRLGEVNQPAAAMVAEEP